MGEKRITKLKLNNLLVSNNMNASFVTKAYISVLSSEFYSFKLSAIVCLQVAEQSSVWKL